MFLFQWQVNNIYISALPSELQQFAFHSSAVISQIQKRALETADQLMGRPDLLEDTVRCMDTPSRHSGENYYGPMPGIGRSNQTSGPIPLIVLKSKKLSFSLIHNMEEMLPPSYTKNFKNLAGELWYNMHHIRYLETLATHEEALMDNFYEMSPKKTLRSPVGY